mmetsp:Transcript_82807/g.230935  ORF Transcript_82807/g.230935 Transcript_82807/m.230935 type:complete len:278 (+) Transcript_82807:279-1112(+)
MITRCSPAHCLFQASATVPGCTRSTWRQLFASSGRTSKPNGMPSTRLNVNPKGDPGELGVAVLGVLFFVPLPQAVAPSASPAFGLALSLAATESTSIGDTFGWVAGERGQPRCTRGGVEGGSSSSSSSSGSSMASQKTSSSTSLTTVSSSSSSPSRLGQQLVGDSVVPEAAGDEGDSSEENDSSRSAATSSGMGGRPGAPCRHDGGTPTCGGITMPSGPPLPPTLPPQPTTLVVGGTHDAIGGGADHCNIWTWRTIASRLLLSAAFSLWSCSYDSVK